MASVHCEVRLYGLSLIPSKCVHKTKSTTTIGTLIVSLRPCRLGELLAIAGKSPVQTSTVDKVSQDLKQCSSVQF